MTEQIPRLQSQGAPSLRPADPSDPSAQAVLLRVFTEAHCADLELLGLEPAALAGLVGMQYRARQAQYCAAHPEAVEYLISGSDGSPVGSCWLDDTPGQLRVLDIAVLREHRRRGIARAVLGSLCEQAGRPVRLSVWHENLAALELYRSLGFTAGGDPGNGYLELEYLPDRAPRLRAGAR